MDENRRNLRSAWIYEPVAYTAVIGTARFFACAVVLVFGVGLITASGCRDSSHQPTAMVFAAASSTDAMEQICRQFELREKVRVQTSFGGSSTLATQILNGAPVDVFLSASLDWVDELESQNLVHEQRQTIGNRLVVIAASVTQTKWQPKQLEDLLDDRVERIAIADPDSVPAGVYAKQAMSSLDLWDRLKTKCVYGADVRQTLAQVESGVAAVGLVYRTDEKISKSAETIFEIPLNLTGPIEFGLVLTTRGASNPAARKLFDFTASEAAQKIFEQHGFVVREETN